MASPAKSLWWYAVALLATAAAFGINLLLAPWIGPNVFPPFLIAVLLCSRHGGWSAGLVATALMLPACSLLLTRSAATAPPALALALRLAMFAGVDLLIVYLMVARSRADKALRSLWRAVEQSPASVVITDRRGAIEYVNPKFTAVTGYSFEEARGHNPRILKGGDLPEEEYRRLWETISRGGEWRGEFHNRRKNGELYWELASISPVRDRDGDIALYVAVKEDITDRKRSEAALQDSEQRFRAMAESLPQLVWVADPGGAVTYLNRRWVEATGLAHDRPVLFSDLAAIHPEDRARCAEAWGQALATGSAFQLELRLCGLDGVCRWYLTRAMPSRNDEGEVREWFGSCTDIDDQKRTEAALMEATCAKDRFLAVLSHELRTPLTPVLLAVTALRENAVKCRGCLPTLEIIRANVELEARLIEDLLDISRIARGKMAYRFETVDLHALVRQAVEICRSEYDAKGHRLRLDLGADAHHVHADPARLQQVLCNLLTNAARYTPAGGHVTVQTRAGGDGGVALSVADDGIGIEPSELPRLFEAFERGGTAEPQRGGGLGLGLSISRSIAEAHGGTLTGESAGRGQGARFTLDLATVAPGPDAKGGDEPAANRGCRPLRILLAEDNPCSARVMASFLGARGHTVTVAANLEEAQAVEPAGFDVVISDLDLGDGSGLDLMRSLRARGGLPGIVLSGYATEDDVQASLAAGFAMHLSKPVTFATLETAIYQVASGAGAGG